MTKTITAAKLAKPASGPARKIWMGGKVWTVVRATSVIGSTVRLKVRLGAARPVVVTLDSADLFEIAS